MLTVVGGFSVGGGGAAAGHGGGGGGVVGGGGCGGGRYSLKVGQCLLKNLGFFEQNEVKCKNPHLLSTMTDSAQCTHEHSRFQSLSPDEV